VQASAPEGESRVGSTVQTCWPVRRSGPARGGRRRSSVGARHGTWTLGAAQPGLGRHRL